MTTRLIIARPLPGTVGETRRVCHLFEVTEEKPTRLVAHCGTDFGPGELELLERPTGMPCEPCLRRAPGPHGSESADTLPAGAPSRPTLRAFQQDLDPLLLIPGRLVVMCMLVDFRWYEDAAVYDALRVTAGRFEHHLDHLAAAGYLEIRTTGRRTKFRITPLGMERLTAYVAALQIVANEAAALVTARRASLESSQPVDAPTPDPASDDL